MKLIIILNLIAISYAARSVLVVSNLLDEQNMSPTVEVYDFLSRTWRLFEPPTVEAKEPQEPSINPRKPQAARLINHDSLLGMLAINFITLQIGR